MQEKNIKHILITPTHDFEKEANTLGTYFYHR